MTGIGAYFYITWGIWLRHSLNGRQDEFDLVWPHLLTSLPVVVRRSDDSNGVLRQNGDANGTAKKII
jgi:dihydroceramidase